MLAAIAGVVHGLVKAVVSDAIENGGEYGWEYVCAVVNDCSQHTESLDSLVGHIESEAVRNRMEAMFEKLGGSIFESAEKCCIELIRIAFSCLDAHIATLFVSQAHNLNIIVCTLVDYLSDYSAGIHDFYYVKLSSLLLQSLVTIYLQKLVAGLHKYDQQEYGTNRISTFDFEDDREQIVKGFQNANR